MLLTMKSFLYIILSIFLYNNCIAWTATAISNDQPVQNYRIQDFIRVGLHSKADLMLSREDLRNGTDATYQVPKEIVPAIPTKNIATFATNFRITDAPFFNQRVLAKYGIDFFPGNFLYENSNAVCRNIRKIRPNICYNIKGWNSSILYNKNKSLNLFKNSMYSQIPPLKYLLFSDLMAY